MKKVARVFAIFLTALVGLPVFAFFAYDLVAFQPHRSEIRAILSEANPQDRNPPPNIRRYIEAMHQDGARPSAAVARALLSRFVRPERALNWHAQYALWDCLVSLHLSQDEILSLYSVLAYNGNGNGLNSLSHLLYSKPLDTLTDREAASVVAFTGSPGYYARHPDMLAKRSADLVSRVQNRP